MKISDILKKMGWTEEKDVRRSTWGSSGTTFYKHPSKNIEFFVQAKEFWVDGKMLAKLSLSRNQDEVILDEINKLMIVKNDFAIHVG